MSGIDALIQLLETIAKCREMREPHLALKQARVLQMGVGVLIAEITEDADA
jgi:hypothetical protein